jgi:hypothetical protein
MGMPYENQCIQFATLKITYLVSQFIGNKPRIVFDFNIVQGKYFFRHHVSAAECGANAHSVFGQFLKIGQIAKVFPVKNPYGLVIYAAQSVKRFVGFGVQCARN